MAEQTPLTDLYTFNPQVGTFSSGVVKDGEFIEDTQILKGLVEAIFKNQFGMDAPDSATPMGRLNEQLALLFANGMRVNVQNANQLVLSAAAGQQLDAIALWFGLFRKPAVSTTVTATLRGSANLVIPAGSRARTEDGAVFVLTEDATLADLVTLPDGTETYQATAVFKSTEVGSIGCLANTLTTIDTPILGWATVTNEADGVLGRETETDDSLRARIDASRFHGNGFIYSMKNAIEAIDGVNSSIVVENYSGERKTVHGIGDMTPHSIFVCVDCADDDLQDVAQAIFDQKPCGTDYHRMRGSIVKFAIDAYGKSYEVYLNRPESCNINLAFVVMDRSYTGNDLAGDVSQAVIDFAAIHGYAIGETVYAADIIRAVENALPGVVVVSCGVTDGGSEQAGSGVNDIHTLAYQEVAAYQKAEFAASRITVKKL